MSRKVVLGLDFGGSKIAAAVCGLDGTIREQRIVPTVPSLGATANLERALDLAAELLGDLSEEGSHASAELVAVGASTFGIPRAHGVELSPAIPGWDGLPLGRRLEDAFGVPVALLTDVKAAASAEACSGALVGSNPGLYLNLGTGLAVAIVHGGVVVAGAHGASGEIGYNLRRSADVWVGDMPGPPMLEDLVSGMGLSAAAGTASATEVFERRQEPAIADLIARFQRELAFQLVNLVNAVDPYRIAVGGGMVGAWDMLEVPLKAALEAHVPYPPELMLGAFPHDAALRGAVRAGVELAGRTNSRSTRQHRQLQHRQGGSLL